MNREQISDIVGSIADRHITATAQYDPRGVSGSPERIPTMNIRSIKKPLLVAAVVALLLALGVSAYAAGWLAPIFHKMQSMTPDTEQKALYKAAEQAVIDQEQTPETVTLSAFDNSKITLSERYYDGKTLLLGVNLEEVVPGMTVGYTRTTRCLQRSRMWPSSMMSTETTISTCCCRRAWSVRSMRSILTAAQTTRKNMTSATSAPSRWTGC